MHPSTAARVAFVVASALLFASATDVPTCDRTSAGPAGPSHCVGGLVGTRAARKAPGGPDGGGLGDEVSALQIALSLGRSGDRSAAEASPDNLTTLPSIDCVRVLHLNGTTDLPFIKQDLHRLGLWRRTIVQTSERDPEGGQAGCYRAHVRAWRESRGCSNLLVLEEDASFDVASTAQCTAHAEAFLQSGTPYDMLFLGYGIDYFDGFKASVSKVSGLECSYRLHGWLNTHAYIISRDAMQEWADLEWDGPLDVSLSRRHDRDKFFAVRPSCAFQRMSSTSVKLGVVPKQAQALGQKFGADPKRIHAEQERLYAASGEAADAERCNG